MQKINIAKILKDCPKGMELDCTMYDNCTLESVLDGLAYPIRIETPDGLVLLNEYGCYSRNKHAKCVIFPKGKTTWEGFQRPFEDGDIVATTSGIWIGIVEGGKNGSFIPTYCVIKSNGEFEVYFDKKERWAFNRLATEEEKEKLFDAIKENGYKWNPETKTLEKLIEPKFKVGDKIRYTKFKHNGNIYIIKDLNETKYIVHNTKDKVKEFHIDFCTQDDLELVPNKFDISTLKTFDKVLVRHLNDGEWVAAFFSHYDKGVKFGCYPFVTTSFKSFPKCIPFENNEHLLGKTDDCDEFYKTW